ncbi:DNA helicase protein [Dioscorea alata]|uniref:DNA helicase protein n=1 Tax=Dioscorea alata TaxID=55571 RepID=A0ACB7UYW6_DIOAL|nr:DNA helicase protein [Dioscorea alata]
MKSLDDLSRRWKIKSSYGVIGFKYQEDVTVAYVASRMPSVYSACHRVLKEVRQRLPGFSPTSVLDFGAGPGSALWAMREVWPRSLERVNLVEQSNSMQRAAQSLLGDLKDLPLIHSYDSIQALNRKLEKRDRAHDLVISSYALGEIPSLRDRITIVHQLWDHTQDVLVKKMKLKNHYEMREYNIEILEDEEEKHAHLECRPYPDVPNASMMVVMNTERFGIAQLHQLRGRVGRGTKKSRCVFLSSTSGTLERLKAYKS